MFKKLLCFLALLVVSLSLCAAASPEMRIVNAYSADRQLVLYVNADKSLVGDVYIGREVCTDVTLEPSIAPRTVILLDNSRSIDPSLRAGIASLIKGIISAGGQDDIFTLATFAHEIDYLVRGSTDREELNRAVDGIVYRNQESYLTNVLYRLFEALENDTDTSYTRIIMIADGADDALLDHTDEELVAKLRDIHVPLYVIGCNMNYNAENLRRLLSFGNASCGVSYVLGETPAEDIIREIAKDGTCVRLTVTPPDHLCDGSERVVSVGIGMSSAAVTLPMPLVETPVIPQQESGSPTVSLFGLHLPLWLLYTLCGVLLAIIAGIVVLIIVNSRKRKKADASDEVITLVGENTASAPILCLCDIENASKCFALPRRTTVIGRDAASSDVVIEYSTHVSAAHCTVIFDGVTYTVRDGTDSVPKSTNGTFVNEQYAASALPLPPGCVLRIGDLRFSVSYRTQNMS